MRAAVYKVLSAQRDGINYESMTIEASCFFTCLIVENQQWIESLLSWGLHGRVHSHCVALAGAIAYVGPGAREGGGGGRGRGRANSSAAFCPKLRALSALLWCRADV